MSCSGEFISRGDVKECSHCGSLSVEDAIKFLQTPGTQFSGSDWKYGWPHKFYIEVPNPDSDELVELGSRTPEPDTPVDKLKWRCYAHGSTPCACPKERATGYYYEPIMGHRKILHYKFYN